VPAQFVGGVALLWPARRIKFTMLLTGTGRRVIYGAHRNVVKGAVRAEEIAG
jgi:hypothetical protein